MEAVMVDKASHCIGLDRKKPYTRHGKKYYRPYRNYYTTGCVDETLEEMHVLGYMEKGEMNQYGGHTYWMTRKGLDWLGEELGIVVYDEEE